MSEKRVVSLSAKISCGSSVSAGGKKILGGIRRLLPWKRS